ncbi:MAG: FHA domain-containing protein [Polyangiaceae bacterium]
MAKAVLTFALYQYDQLTRRETVTQDIVKVGKDPKSHLRVDDELASRMHAVIEVAGAEDITLIDLGNEPGTMVNGARVNKCKLHVGDQIQVGETKIILESAEPAGAEAQPVAAHRAAPPAFAAPPPNPFGGRRRRSRRLLRRSPLLPIRLRPLRTRSACTRPIRWPCPMTRRPEPTPTR